MDQGPQDWGTPLVKRVLQRAGVGRGTMLLDLGCGAGRLCRIAADRGAQVTGIDRDPRQIQQAVTLVPEGTFDVGDILALDAEPVWTKLRVGDPLRQCHRARHHDGRVAPAWLVEQGIERRDPEADEVGRRSELRFVADCPRGVEADDSRSKEGPEIDSEVARGAIVGRNDKSRPRA